MNKRWNITLFFLIFVLCPDGSLQGKDQKFRPRTFVGELPKVFTPNQTTGDEVSNRSLSNSTVQFLRGSLSTRFIPAAYLLAVAVGVPANAAILCTLFSKVRKVSTAILYSSLAASDLLLLLSLCFRAHYHLHANHWVLGEAACRVVTACFYGNLYCSAHTLACISIKRYLAVVHPFMYKGLPKRTCTAWAGLAVWTVFAAAMLPTLLVKQSFQWPELDVTTCHDVLPLRQTHAFLLYYDMGLAVFGLLLPLLVTTFCNARIVQELNQSQSDWSVYIRSSVVLLVIFLVCFTPATVLHLVHHVQLFMDYSDGLYVYFKVAVCLCCLHACIDPFLFLLMSKSSSSRLRFRPISGNNTSISL